MKYIKIFGYEWLEGSIRKDLTSAGRGIWADCLALASISRRKGYLERSEGIPYTDEELASKFVVTLEELQGVIKDCLLEGRLTRDKTNTLFITNWDEYQDYPLGETGKERKKIKADEAQAKEELEAGGVNVQEKYGHKPNPRKLPSHDQYTTPEEYTAQGQAGWRTGINIVKGEGGVIDEQKSILFGQSLCRIRRVLKGEEPCLPANKKRYIEALTKLKIPFEAEGEK